MKTKDLGFSYLGNINSSSKIAKTAKNENMEIDTYVLYLAPSDLSGQNVCPMATKECITGCLNTSGRAKMDASYKMIMGARMKKTKLFFDKKNPDSRKIFNEILFSEIASHSRRAANKGRNLAVRLNGTSDLNPILFTHNGKNVLESFPDLQFYDYTKVLKRVELAKKYTNYDLTFSFSGYNWNDCVTALENNVRVAMIFNIEKGKPLPKTYKGIEVVDGDTYDYRPADAKNVIVGLRWKNIRNKRANSKIKVSPFVIQPNDTDCKF
jgi:hypothetical protein